MTKEDLVKLAQSLKVKLGLADKSAEKPAEETPPSVELEETPAATETPAVELAESPTVEDVLNVAGLASAINLADIKDGSFCVWASVEDGKITWADVSVTDWKVLMSEQKATTDAKILELEKSIKEKDAKIVALSADGKDSGIAQAPVAVEAKPQTRAEQLIANI